MEKQEGGMKTRPQSPWERRYKVLEQQVATLTQQLADAWAVLGHPYGDRYSVLAEALCAVRKQLQESETVATPLVEQCEKYRRQVATLTEALRKHGRHCHGCSQSKPEFAGRPLHHCTCGLAATLAAVRGER